MLVAKSVGYSEATAIKSERFRNLISHHLSTVRSVWKNKGRWCVREYRYIDANAGPGCYPDGVDGSPVIFLKAANELGVPYTASFIEIDGIVANELEKCVGFYDDWNLVTSDNKTALMPIIHSLPIGTFGSVFFDANGVPDFDLISEVSEHPKAKTMDLIIRCPASAIKRNYYQKRLRLEDYLKGVNKSDWVVGKIERGFKGENWHWTFLIGLNWKGWNTWKSKGFHYWTSKEGKSIFYELNYGKKDRQIRMF